MFKVLSYDHIAKLNSNLNSLKIWSGTVSFSFPNRNYSLSVNLETVTGNIVTKNNVISLFGIGQGYPFYFTFDSNKNVVAFGANAINADVDVYIIAFYS